MFTREFNTDVKYNPIPTKEIIRNLKNRYGDRFVNAHVAYKLEDENGVHKGKWLVWRLRIG